MKSIKAAALVELPARVTENIHDGAILRLLVIAEGRRSRSKSLPYFHLADHTQVKSLKQPYSRTTTDLIFCPL